MSTVPQQTGQTTAMTIPAMARDRLDCWDAAPLVVFVFTLVGYPLIAAATAVSGIDNRPVSIAMRATVLLVAFVAIGRALKSGRLHPNRILWMLWWVFWIGYSARLLTDAFITGSLRNLPTFEYLAFAFGVCLVPALALEQPRIRSVLRLAPLLLLVSGVIALIANGWVIFFQQGLAEIVSLAVLRAESDVLNPISIGHLGVTVALLATWFLLASRSLGVSATIALIGAVGLGVVALIASGSRGPTLAFVVGAVLLFFLVPGRIALRAAIVALGAVGLVLVAGWRRVAETYWLERLTTEMFADDTRMQLLRASWELFTESPLVGAGVEPLFSYPHNLVVESFMAGGILVGAAFVLLVMYAVWRAADLCWNNRQYLWLGVLFVQHLVGGMVSGALYFSSSFWVLLVAITAVSQYGTVWTVGVRRMKPLEEMPQASRR